MKVSALPFENGQEVEVEVLSFKPWTEKKDTDFIFEVEGAVFSIVSPYGFRSKKFEKGDKVLLEFERFKNNYGNEAGRLKFLDKL